MYTDQGRSVGLVVDRILDIAHEAVKIRKHSGRQGTLGSMVVQGRVTELLDMKGIIQTADPNFFEDWDLWPEARRLPTYRATGSGELMAGRNSFPLSLSTNSFLEWEWRKFRRSSAIRR